MGVCDFVHIPGTIILHDSTMILILIYVTILNPKMFFKILCDFCISYQIEFCFQNNELEQIHKMQISCFE